MKIAILITLFIYLALAKDIFLFEKYPLQHLTISKDACSQNLKNSHQICQSYSLEYVECEDSCKDKNLASILEEVQQEYISKLKSQNPKKDLKDRVNDEFDTANWDDSTKVNLFATTPTTVTLQEEKSGYSGGAHGYYSIYFLNIDKASYKNIELKELFLPDTNRSLHKIALYYYKLSHNLPLNKPLSLSDNWFDDEFILASSFAITRYGLYFLYNQYEVKAYAYGVTKFFLPYEAIKDLIEPKSVLNFVFNEGLVREYKFIDKSDDGALVASDLKIKYLSKNRVRLYIDVKFDLDYSAPKAWLSISFKDFKNTKNIKVISSKGVKVSRYRAGNRIFNIKKARAFRAKYALLEGEINRVKNKKHYNIVVDIKVPKKILILDFRVTARDNNKKIVIFTSDDFNGNVIGQQDFENHRVLIPMYNIKL